MKVQDKNVLLPNPVYLGFNNENDLLQKNKNSFFDRVLDISQIYEAIRIINLCNNLDNSAARNIKCDNNKLDEIGKTNYIIRGWQLSKLDEYQRIKKKF